MSEEPDTIEEEIVESEEAEEGTDAAREDEESDD